MMGSLYDDREARNDEKLAKSIMRGFDLGETEATQGQYKAVTPRTQDGSKARTIYGGTDQLADAVKYANSRARRKG